MLCPISVKFGVRSLYLMLLCVYECSQIRRNEGLSFIMGVTEIHLRVYRETMWHFEIKNV